VVLTLKKYFFKPFLISEILKEISCKRGSVVKLWGHERAIKGSELRVK
jgi:hypothetical protein